MDLAGLESSPGQRGVAASVLLPFCFRFGSVMRVKTDVMELACSSMLVRGSLGVSWLLLIGGAAPIPFFPQIGPWP